MKQFSNSWQNLLEGYERLAFRDKLALWVLGGFLGLVVFGYGGYSLHQKANASKKAYDAVMSDVFWLRSQAGNINPNQSQPSNPTENLQQILAQSGVTGQVAQSGENIQLNFSHSQAIVINNVFNQIQQQGFSIQQLQINQTSPDKLDVQSVLSR
ncbi:type II secretion system protein GspM [Faucicola boevrei]|uniref:type II secretion system protein GspM n=1 Tax=Faucicola boevrei TaxID=346665 RepID=UPI00036E676F|nr:type II secretion system protein GspM [Moraxella boevrei]